MPFYLRIIRKKYFWLGCSKYKNTSNVTADLIQDFYTKENSLSIWYIEADQSNLNHILAAYACTQDDIREIQYAIIPCNLLSSEDFNIEQKGGNTPDSEANKNWHFDILNLTGDTLLKVIKIFFHNCDPETIYNFDVKDIIVQSIKEKRISNKNINGKIKPIIEGIKNELSNIDTIQKSD